MRAVLASCVVVTLAAGCTSTAANVQREPTAGLPAGSFVTVTRLAQSLRLSYFGEEKGLIELAAPPDQIMLVADSRRVLVNGSELSMEHPCVLRGDEFALRTVDAHRVGETLTRLRARRAPRVVTPAEPPRKAQVVVARPRLPPAWRPSAPARPWRYIVIHHQAAARGSAAVIHRAHLARGMDGLGYHFVIGNGSLTGDGEIEVGYRWRGQIHGAHTRAHPGDDNRWNNYGIGICLVGDFRYTRPSPAQMGALVRLVRALQATYHISAGRVVPHNFVKDTICPGPRFPWAEFQARIR